MILMGTLPDPPAVRVHLVADVSRFNDAMDRAKAKTDDLSRLLVSTARNMLLLDVTLEVLGLSVDQTWTLFYVRGGFDPDFATPDAVDNYLRVLTRLKGERGQAAVEGFLTGWAQHHDTEVEPLVWHRYLGGVEMRVSAA